ncbi:cellobiose transport system substrate-binding protein [Amycolatopsis arida]|uniref:Cellobiose transport system substrate-binding protein n=1 Tax=Amycolatopsis arida TaxID=587909 RepID=A0A1I5XT40_9PSEU|nr:extracellular solute-binding protein [Amycolatopsis arida]TDX97280.1 cellobiose transport system substrate-binding protein [Amycolatopsis arida]SFQ35125.1 cellobiose transport system substrate-binding protein [Amycolatopsis arida]
MRRTPEAARKTALLAATALLLTACGGGDPAEDGTTTLTINVFGDNFSLPDNRTLYDEYERLNPGVRIVENRGDYSTHHQNLQARLTAGSGAADIELIEVGQIAGFTGQPDEFVDFTAEGVDTAQWTPAVLQRASTPDGQTLIGLPTDVGGLAVCYRTDLFEQAGLPTDRDAVSALWPTWRDYVDTGQRFLASAPDGVKWFDTGGHVFLGVLGNESETFYDAAGELIVERNPAVRAAWDLTVSAIREGQSAALAEFSPEWNTGFQQGQFATVTCPAWMMGYIQGNAPETRGTWDIATIPGGSGNWGGSYVTVPAGGENVEAAVRLATWLTAPEQAVTIFRELGNFPSQRSTWTRPEVADYAPEFFNGAPAGRIFPASLENAPVQVTGPQSGVIGNAFSDALNSVEQGADPEAAWRQVMSDIESAAGTG